MSIALIVSFVVFFFKQKTAYEMRISDWSSDVCSSDLIEVMRVTQLAGELRRAGVGADVEHPVLHRRRHHGHRQVRPAAAGHAVDLVALDELVGYLLGAVGLLGVVLDEHLDAHLTRLLQRQHHTVPPVYAEPPRPD